jgi:hypothetical protein
MDDEELTRLATEEMLRWAKESPGIEVLLDVPDAMTLLANLQLALTHPLNTGKSAAMCLSLAKRIESHLVKIGPFTAEVCKRGWRTGPSH